MGVRGVLGGRGLAALLLLSASAAGAMEVRVRSEGAGTATRVVIDVGGGAIAVIDRTPNATTPGDGRLSAGTTFADEITLELPGVSLDRPLAIDVSDDLVSEVRARPTERGSRVVVFVRRPVTYEVRAAEGDQGLAVTLLAVVDGRPPAAGAGPGPSAGTDDARVSIDAESV